MPAKTPAQDVVCQHNIARCGAGPNHIVERQTRPSQEIHCFSLKPYVPLRLCAMWRSVGCQAEVSSEGAILLDWVPNVKRFTELRGLHVADKHLFIATFLQADMIPAHLYNTLVGIVQHSTQSGVRFPSGQVAPWQICFLSRSSSIKNKATSCSGDGISMSFLSLKKAEIVHRWFVVLHCWADGFALPRKVFTELNAPSMIPMENLFELFCFIQTTFHGETALRAEVNRTLRNPFVNASVATRDKCGIDECIGRYLSMTLLLCVE